MNEYIVSFTDGNRQATCLYATEDKWPSWEFVLSFCKVYGESQIVNVWPVKKKPAKRSVQPADEEFEQLWVKYKRRGNRGKSLARWTSMGRAAKDEFLMLIDLYLEHWDKREGDYAFLEGLLNKDGKSGYGKYLYLLDKKEEEDKQEDNLRL